VPSERQWATQRPRRDEEGAPRTLERRAGRSSSPAGSRLSAMGGAAARGTCAAWAARAHPWRRASTTRDGPARQARTAPHRPADASRSAPIAGGEVELALRYGGWQGTPPASGRACRARCARRDRSGASLGSPALPRRARPTCAAPIAGGEVELGPAVRRRGRGHAVDPTHGQNCNR